MEKEHEYTPDELRELADNYRDGYWLWGKMEKEHPDWPYQQLAGEYIKKVVKQPRVEKVRRRNS